MRFVWNAALVAAGFLLWSASSHADEPDDRLLSPSFHACMERAQGVNAMMRACMADEQQRLDGALNTVFSELMAMMHAPAARQSLVESERAWLAHRQSQCAFEETQQAEGSLRPMLFSGCWLKETAKRVAELEQRRDFEARWHAQ